MSQEEQLCGKVEEMLAGEKLDAIVCVAGGWAGGNAASKGNAIFPFTNNDTCTVYSIFGLLISSQGAVWFRQWLKYVQSYCLAILLASVWHY